MFLPYIKEFLPIITKMLADVEKYNELSNRTVFGVSNNFDAAIC